MRRTSQCRSRCHPGPQLRSHFRPDLQLRLRCHSCLQQALRRGLHRGGTLVNRIYSGQGNRPSHRPLRRPSHLLLRRPGHLLLRRPSHLLLRRPSHRLLRRPSHRLLRQLNHRLSRQRLVQATLGPRIRRRPLQFRWARSPRVRFRQVQHKSPPRHLTALVMCRSA
jgi:hypothetical protein